MHRHSTRVHRTDLQPAKAERKTSCQMIVEIPALRWLGRDKNDLTAAS
jgi:hypothetical protein